MFFASCGGDDCTQADWVGTYTLDADSVDDLCGVTFANTLTIAADSTDAITINGDSWSLDNCEVGESVLGIGLQYTLDGTSIELINGVCKGTYNK